MQSWTSEIARCLKGQTAAVDAKTPVVLMMLFQANRRCVRLRPDCAVLTAGAMPCRTKTAKAFISRHTDNILTVKGNQLALQEASNATLLNAIVREDPKL